MLPLRHGYTNDARSDGTIVVKRYQGPDAEIRRRTEKAMLEGLQGLLPVPALLAADEHSLSMPFLAGVHGQELIDAGQAAAVLHSCGRTLRLIHAIDPARVFPDCLPGLVVVHGDYGPNNLLLDPGTMEVTAVLDWEWAHPGDPVDDLAWCEWIVRMHHAEHIDALGELFDGYGHRPAWTQRRCAMLARCESLVELCQRWTPQAVDLWRHRWSATAAWTE